MAHAILRVIIPLAICFAPGCAGRSAAPIATVQALDATMDCTALRAQLSADVQRQADLKSEQAGKVAQNVGAAVGALVLWPLVFAMDFQDAATADLHALEVRDQYLTTLALQRCSDMPQMNAEAVRP